MSAQDMRTALEVFGRLRELPAGERQNVLDSDSSLSPQARDCVRSLLANDSPTGQFLGSTIHTARAAALRPLVAGAIPARIGRYEVLRVLGHGGFGTVYLARQASPRREVAIKLMRQISTPAERRRLLFEAQVLARLSHPCIARVYESGVTDDGLELPFIVLEYIDGPTLDVYAQEKKPSRDEIVRLLIQVCDGLGHAHQRGVLHRDLAPKNILLDSQGCIKILDFGLACAIDHAPASSMALTAAGDVLGTLRFISPEQLRGEISAIDTRSDLYSLGLISFELLTGRHPFLTGDESLATAVSTLLEAAPARPSATNPGLRGDLESVLLKAIDRAPEARYQSAGELARDLRNVLEGLAVTARAATPLYRARKFIGRHRVAATLAAAGVLVIGGFAANSLLALRKEARSRDTAINALDAVVSRVLSPLAPKMGTLAERAELLEAIGADVQQMAAAAPEDVRAVRLLASYLVAFGDVQREQEHLEPALRLYERAVAAYEQLTALAPQDAPARHALSLACVKVGDVLRGRGEMARGLAWYRRSLAMDEALAAQHPTDVPALSNLFWSYCRLETVSQDEGPDAAAKYLTLAAQTADRMVAADPSQWRSLEAQSRARYRLALAASRRGDHAESLKHNLAAFDAAQRLVATAPDSMLNQGMIALTGVCAARSLIETGDLEKAQRVLALITQTAEYMREQGCTPQDEVTYVAPVDLCHAYLAETRGDWAAAEAAAARHARVIRPLFESGFNPDDSGPQLLASMRLRADALLRLREFERLKTHVTDLRAMLDLAQARCAKSSELERQFDDARVSIVECERTLREAGVGL
ncbi:MAG: serine/threonine protein kinase [Planctomycetes bacterium]|nr:serine/threonine protein kinase [Planctomycetota bacterium]